MANHLTRRSVLATLAAGTVAAPALGGCATSTTNTPEEQPGVDVPAAREAITSTRTAIALITTTIARHPRLRTDLAPLLAMHRAHLRRLRTVDSGDIATKPGPGRVPGNATRALARIHAAEGARATRLDTLAASAHSGGFARMLASMAAAIDQHTAGMAA